MPSPLIYTMINQTELCISNMCMVYVVNEPLFQFEKIFHWKTTCKIIEICWKMKNMWIWIFCLMLLHYCREWKAQWMIYSHTYNRNPTNCTTESCFTIGTLESVMKWVKLKIQLQNQNHSEIDVNLFLSFQPMFILTQDQTNFGCYCSF